MIPPPLPRVVAAAQDDDATIPLPPYLRSPSTSSSQLVRAETPATSSASKHSPAPSTLSPASSRLTTRAFAAHLLRPSWIHLQDSCGNRRAAVLLGPVSMPDFGRDTLIVQALELNTIERSCLEYISSGKRKSKLKVN